MIDGFFYPAIDERVCMPQDDGAITKAIINVPFSIKIIDIGVASVSYDECLIVP